MSQEGREIAGICLCKFPPLNISTDYNGRIGGLCFAVFRVRDRYCFKPGIRDSGWEKIQILFLRTYRYYRDGKKSNPGYTSRIRITAVLISEWLLLFGALLVLLVPGRDFRI
jgi:hypothetical protein